MHEQQAFGRGDRLPRLSWRNDGKLTFPDFGRLISNTDDDVALDSLERHTASLIRLVEGRSVLERDEGQPEPIDLGEGGGVPIPDRVLTLATQPLCLSGKLESHQRGAEVTRIALLAAAGRQDLRWWLRHRGPPGHLRGGVRRTAGLRRHRRAGSDRAMRARSR
jgi:hypothetical protein